MEFELSAQDKDELCTSELKMKLGIEATKGAHPLSAQGWLRGPTSPA